MLNWVHVINTHFLPAYKINHNLKKVLGSPVWDGYNFLSCNPNRTLPPSSLTYYNKFRNALKQIETGTACHLIPISPIRMQFTHSL